MLAFLVSDVEIFKKMYLINGIRSNELYYSFINQIMNTISEFTVLYMIDVIGLILQCMPLSIETRRCACVIYMMNYNVYLEINKQLFKHKKACEDIHQVLDKLMYNTVE